MRFPKTTLQLVELIAAIQTPSDVEEVKKLIWYRLHWPELHNALFGRLTALLQPTDPKPLADSPGFLHQNGVIYDLNQWITFREYIQRHGINSTSVLNNWISRGIIPPECVVEITALNDLKLVYDQPYQPG